MNSPGFNFHPGRLWSLWDIMKPFNAALFMKFMEAAGMTRTLIDLGTLTRPMSLNDVSPGWVADWLKLMDLYEQGCVDLELDASVATIRKLRAALIKPDPLSAEVNPLTIELGGRLHDEMDGKFFWSLTLSETEYYSNPLKGWEEVIARFQATHEDIEEAGKCLALGRATATVFHLMRALESAMLPIADKLGAAIIDSYGRGLPWGVVADNMKPKIDAMPKGSAEQIKWYRVQHDLVVVNRAWRVPTNHPKETYTIEQANEVYDATKTFMKELAPFV